MTRVSDLSVSIIGAGLAGLACAQRLGQHGVPCRVFDRGRRVGGRVNTRLIELDGEKVRFDHGAPLLHARTSAFQRVVDAWIACGIVQELDETDTSGVPGTRVVRAVGGMQSIPEYLADGLDIRCSCTAEQVERVDDGWTLRFRHYEREFPETTRTGAVVFACPFPQSARVLDASGVYQPDQLIGVGYDPTWVCMMLLGKGLPSHTASMCLRPDQPDPIESIELRSHTPGKTTLVARLSAPWGMAHAESNAREVEAFMVEQALRLLDERFPMQYGADSVRIARVHRWGLAFAQETVDRSHVFDRSRFLGFAGDMFAGPAGEWRDAEASYLSGQSLGDDLVKNMC